MYLEINFKDRSFVVLM